MAGRKREYLYSPLSDKVLAPHVGGFLSEESVCCKQAVETGYLAMIHS